METLVAIIIVTVLVGVGTWFRRRQVLLFLEEYGRTEEEGVFHGEDFEHEIGSTYHTDWAGSEYQNGKVETWGAGGGSGDGASGAAGPSEISVAVPKQEG